MRRRRVRRSAASGRAYRSALRKSGHPRLRQQLVRELNRAEGAGQRRLGDGKVAGECDHVLAGEVRDQVVSRPLMGELSIVIDIADEVGAKLQDFAVRSVPRAAVLGNGWVCRVL